MIKSSITIPISATVEMHDLATQKRLAGEKIFNLSAGEPVIPTPAEIKNAALEALKRNKTLYPPVSGIPPLRQAAVEWMNKNHKAHYNFKNCLVVNGGKFGLYLLFQTLMQKGKEVLIPSPFWTSYPDLVRLFGGKPKIIPTKESKGWKITAQDILKRATAKTRILILNNASNPTGTIYTKTELSKILATAKKLKLTIISDEVYSGLIYDKQRFVSCCEFPQISQDLIVIQSCSKNFAMTGWRVGFVFAPENIIRTLSALTSQSTSGVSTLSQWAALAALSADQRLMNHINKLMAKRRDVFFKTFNALFKTKIPPPKSGLYGFIPLSALVHDEKDSSKFCFNALKQANVAIVPGKAFGQEGYVRFSFGAPEKDLKQGLKALADFCKRYSH